MTGIAIIGQDIALTLAALLLGILPDGQDPLRDGLFTDIAKRAARRQ